MLRFAASPTGDMHLNDLRVAIVNYIYAKQKDEAFIVRIEDSDKARNIPGKDEEILMLLEKFALPHSQLFYQSENLHMHQTLAIRLLEEKKAFIAMDDGKEFKEAFDKHELTRLKEEKVPFQLHLHKPDASISIHDLIQGDITTTPDAVGSFVILDSDGIPSPNFASACDDMLSGIKMIISTDTHLTDAPKQSHIQNMLGYSEAITYIHLPPLLDADISVISLFEEGFLPDAIINYLIQIGNKTPVEIFTLPEAMEWFDIETISKTAERFDKEQLRMTNREHTRGMEDKRLSSLFGFADSDIGALAKLYLEEASTINELKSKIEPIFAKKECRGEWESEMRSLQKLIVEAPMIDEFERFEKYLIEHSGLSGEALSQPLRVLLTGAKSGPKLSSIYSLIKSYITEVAA